MKKSHQFLTPIFTFFAAGLALMPISAVHAQLKPGDSVIIDQEAGTDSRGALFSAGGSQISPHQLHGDQCGDSRGLGAQDSRAHVHLIETGVPYLP
jgi:hypothetical protein